VGFAGSISYHFNTVYFVLSGLAAGAALFAACCSVFATLVTILIGLPNTVFGKGERRRCKSRLSEPI
jgi:hypothetical protein